MREKEEAETNLDRKKGKEIETVCFFSVEPFDENLIFVSS